MGKINKKFALATAVVAACGSASASEDYDLRYAPGIGGADMSAPFEGGWVFQAPLYVYSGHLTSTSTVPVTVPVPNLGNVPTVTTVDTHTQINVTGILPRLSYMSAETFLGATVGGTALFPILAKRNSSRITGLSTSVNAPGVPAAIANQIAAGVEAEVGPQVDALAAANSVHPEADIGDIELSPILRWAGDSSQTLAILTVVLPTGDYRPERAANPSAGAFYTLRPAVQYSYIGDGWDFGGRAAFSINTANGDTHYHTGNYLNVDMTGMKSINDAMRVGLSGYAVVQTTRDSVSSQPDMSTPEGQAMAARQAPTEDKKGHVFGVGPEFAYIQGAGDFLLDGRVMKEFAASDRPQGFTAIVQLSKPF